MKDNRGDMLQIPKSHFKRKWSHHHEIHLPVWKCNDNTCMLYLPAIVLFKNVNHWRITGIMLSRRASEVKLKRCLVCSNKYIFKSARKKEDLLYSWPLFFIRYLKESTHWIIVLSSSGGLHPATNFPGRGLQKALFLRDFGNWWFDADAFVFFLNIFWNGCPIILCFTLKHWLHFLSKTTADRGLTELHFLGFSIPTEIFQLAMGNS